MKKNQSLTGKIYLIEFLSGTLFYVIGVLLLTPSTSPSYVKYVAIGSLMTIQVMIIVYTAFVRSEKIDERAKYNYYKASSITLYITVILLFLLGIAIKIFSINFNFSSGLIALILATILCVHALSFNTLEQAS